VPELPPSFPAGPFEWDPTFDEGRKETLLNDLEMVPGNLRRTVAGLDATQLDVRYKNWTIRQIVHHLADSHVHVYIRFKWSLTEDCPLIKAYNEGDWSLLNDAVRGDIAPALALLDGLHVKWLQLLRGMTPEQFRLQFLHPESGEHVSLWQCLWYYTWHGRHHTSQIEWLKNQNGWT